MIEMPGSVSSPMASEEHKVSPFVDHQDCDTQLSTEQSIFTQSVPSAQTDEIVNSMPLLPHLWISVITITAGPRILWQCSTLGLPYYLLLLGLLILVDAALDFRWIASRVITFMVVSAGLAPLHTLWTHSMIALPSADSMFCRGKRVCSRYNTLLLPSLVHSGAQALTVVIPFIMAEDLG